jgi:hypothetical protein
MAVGPGLPYPDADELANHWWWRPGWQVGTRFYTWHVTVADLLAGQIQPLIPRTAINGPVSIQAARA